MMNEMERMAKGICIGTSLYGHDRLTFNVTPIWDDEELMGFRVSAYSCDEEFENFQHFEPMETTIDELVDFLEEVRRIHNDTFSVNIFAYYHGCKELARFYDEVIDYLDCYNTFHMEYEWG